MPLDSGKPRQNLKKCLPMPTSKLEVVAKGHLEIAESISVAGKLGIDAHNL